MTDASVVPTPHPIKAADGRELAAHTYPGEGDDVVVIAGATGVPQRFYRDFALAIVERGATTITFDYRGTGASRNGPPRSERATMRDWGQLDIEGVLRHASEHTDGRVLWVGQSAGAAFLPLADSRRLPARILTVSAMSGYWGDMAKGQRWRLALGWYTYFPLVAALCGYAPSWAWGGDDLPRGVLAEWGRWCRDPDFIFGDATLDTSGFAEITAPVLAVRAADDGWATPATHAALHDRLIAATVETRVVEPDEVDADRIGHIHLLHRSVGRPVWPELLDWLLAA
ncbi:hypothetical protein ER308_18015 [Egibacter rhizosphaerae]|uniref:Alpha/beta fold hydrolase n=1 Tax=Egibacter rhizosphaerae TaxID=1670831 RepID=A0A411YJH6_9ACTN|nr:hypothetical protein [Egibacter rhizosphaerae]QBI21279.1 hypothetical protein ER308_18015 [Egibacter rhizosphaerae]